MSLCKERGEKYETSCGLWLVMKNVVVRTDLAAVEVGVVAIGVMTMMMMIALAVPILRHFSHLRPPSRWISQYLQQGVSSVISLNHFTIPLLQPQTKREKERFSLAYDNEQCYTNKLFFSRLNLKTDGSVELFVSFNYTMH